MSEAPLLLEARNVAKRFDLVVALKAASLQVRPGEVHGLMGSNGAGKSTLVKIITGVFPADGGQIFVKGVARSFRSPAEARSAGIVSVYQDPALVPDLTVAQNMRLAGASIDAVRKWLAELGVVRLDFSLLVRDLPYPTLRLIDLARALASEPAVLLLDEITASLPADLSERIYAMVKHWRERGNAVIFISHRMAEVSALCDRATVLRDGVTVGVTERAHGSEERIVALMLGAETARAVASAASTRASRQTPLDAQAALEVRGLRRSPLLNDVSFKLYPGEVLGVAALEGQGQEELFDCIAGSRRYDEGAILAHGKELKLRHPADAIAAGIVLVPANRLLALLQQRPIRENIALPAFGGIRNWGPIRMRAERSARRIRDRTPANRHPRWVGTAQIERRQPAEGGDRALARQRLQHSAVLRSYPRHRYRHEAPDLRLGPGTGGWRDPRCCCSLRNFPRSRWLAIVRSSCSVGAWSPRCQCPRPMKPRCCAPRMGSPRWRRLPHDYARRR